MKHATLTAFAFFFASLVSSAGLARAEDLQPAPATEAAVLAEAHPRRSFSLTWSPIHLVLPVVELTGELRLADKVSVAVIAGAGKSSSETETVEATVFEVGVQPRYYVLGDFRHGMQIGAEALYLHASADMVEVSGRGLAVGPFVGYKYTADIGFTFDAQLGAQFMAVTAERDDGSERADDSDVIPLLNLNAGWSF